MDERAGCAVLKRRFEAAGLEIIERFSLYAEGIAITLDGFDPARRVGYEYVTTEAGDRAEVTADVVAALEAHMAAGDFTILLVDEEAGGGEAGLSAAADRFLEELRRRGRLA